MEQYSKPVIITQRECRGIIPLAGIAAADAVFAAGLAAGLASTLGGDDVLPRTNILNRLDLIYDI